MFMRYRGGGIGHLTTRTATDFFKRDRHHLEHCTKQPPANIESDNENDDPEANSTEEPLSGGEENDSADSDEDDETSEGESEQEAGEGEGEGEDSDSEDGEEGEMEQLGFAEL
jgi:hypothetical protein